jgi:acetyltransferase-like isoleucine patch superfamily enzyme
VGVALVALYLLPPLAARLSAWLMPLPRGEVELDERGFLAWWLSAQWQVIFNRARLLEEALRLVPGAYSAWLRLWGSRVGSLVYWSPGVELLDRGLLEIGDRVVFGAGVRLAGHVLLPGADRRVRLLVGPVKVGREALVGAYSMLPPCAEVAEGSVSPPLRLLRSSLRPSRRDGEPG